MVSLFQLMRLLAGPNSSFRLFSRFVIVCEIISRVTQLSSGAGTGKDGVSDILSLNDSQLAKHSSTISPASPQSLWGLLLGRYRALCGVKFNRIGSTVKMSNF